STERARLIRLSIVADVVVFGRHGIEQRCVALLSVSGSATGRTTSETSAEPDTAMRSKSRPSPGPLTGRDAPPDTTYPGAQGALRNASIDSRPGRRDAPGIVSAGTSYCAIASKDE